MLSAIYAMTCPHITLLVELSWCLYTDLLQFLTLWRVFIRSPIVNWRRGYVYQLPLKNRSTLELTQSLVIGRDSMFFFLAPEYECFIYKEREMNRETERGRGRERDTQTDRQTVSQVEEGCLILWCQRHGSWVSINNGCWRFYTMLFFIQYKVNTS